MEDATTKKLFSDFGIDTRSEEQILQEIVQRRMAAAQEAAALPQYRYAGEQDLRSSGAALGAILANKVNKPKLDPQQQAMIDARKYADNAVQLMAAGGKFTKSDGSLDALAMGEARMEKVAEQLINSGDPRGVDLAGKVYQNRQGRERDQQAREKHGITMKQDRLDYMKDSWQFDQDRFIAKRGELATIYPRGSNDPNAGIMAFIDQQGDAWTTQGDTIGKMRLGDYVTVRPMAPGKDGKGGGFIPPTPSEVDKMRAQQRSIMAQARSANVIVDALATAIEESETGTLDILNGAGKFQIFTTNLANNINAIASQGESWIGLTDGDPKDPNSKIIGRLDGSISNSLKYARDNKEYVSRMIALPESIEAGSIQAERFQAAIVQLAYAKARAQEPGARQLSDIDFKNALRTIGANATSPDALREVMLDNLSGSRADFDFWMKQMPDEMKNKVVTPAAMQEYNEALDFFEKRYEVSWGTRANPQGALVQEPLVRRHDKPVEAPKDETFEERKARLLGRP